MTEVIYPQESGDPVVVELRDPYWAAFLAWLVPGAGHVYQRRYAKGLLFMVCVLTTFFVGLGLGRGRCVYASFKNNDFRWQYVCQLGAGAVALPAVAQAIKTQDGGEPFLVLCERYPKGFMGPDNRPLEYSIVPADTTPPVDSYKDGFMAPPAGPLFLSDNDVLGMWHFEMKHMFEIGTLYTVVAGLLNLLAIYDAFCGPAILTPEQKEKLEAKKKRRRAAEDEPVGANEPEQD